MGETMSEEEAETVTEEQENAQPGEPNALPDDHPLVKALAAQKVTIKDLKAKAARLDEIEEAQKTAEEKNAERIAKAEAEAASVPQKVTDALRAHLVAIHTISDEDAELFLTASEPELLLKQVARLVAQTPQGPQPNPQQGNPSKGPAKGGALGLAEAQRRFGNSAKT